MGRYCRMSSGLICPVNVHVVTARDTCPAGMRSPTMPAHEQRASLITRPVGAPTSGGAGLYPRPRSQGGGVGGNGSAVAGAAATDLAHLVAPAVERPATSAGQTAAARIQRASTWGATRARGTCPGGGAHRAG